MCQPISESAFLYLISSLIQVFGTLVAADTIFLVVLYEYFVRRLDQSLIRLGMMAEEASGNNYLPSLQGKNVDLIRYKARADIFLSLDDSEIANRLKKTQETLINGINSMNTDADQKKERQEGLKYFESHKSRLDKIRKELCSFPKLVIKIMSVPALLSLLFAIFLLFGSGTGWYSIMSWVSVILSGGGFIWVIYWAVRAWPKNI